MVFYIFGRDVWLFPNLLDDKLGIIDSFKPFISASKREESWVTILIRFAIACSLGITTAYVYLNPHVILDGVEHFKEIYTDVLSWGNDKIINYHNGTSISIINKSDKYNQQILDEGLDY